MNGNASVIAICQEQLSAEGAAIIQYAFHHEAQEVWGYAKLSDETFKAAREEMGHFAKLSSRIVFLEGVPVGVVKPDVTFGATIEEQITLDAALEEAAIE